MILKLWPAIYLAPVLLRRNGELDNKGVYENTRTWRKVAMPRMHALPTMEIF